MTGKGQERFTYQIEVLDRVDGDDLNAMSPLEIRMIGVEAGDARPTTLFSVCADQSGLIGMLRHLHARGLVLVSVVRK
jgi:hypothetical protein